VLGLDLGRGSQGRSECHRCHLDPPETPAPAPAPLPFARLHAPLSHPPLTLQQHAIQRRAFTHSKAKPRLFAQSQRVVPLHTLRRIFYPSKTNSLSSCWTVDLALDRTGSTPFPLLPQPAAATSHSPAATTPTLFASSVSVLFTDDRSIERHVIPRNWCASSGGHNQPSR
jgi:hypothetical protein